MSYNGYDIVQTVETNDKATRFSCYQFSNNFNVEKNVTNNVKHLFLQLLQLDEADGLYCADDAYIAMGRNR